MTDGNDRSSPDDGPAARGPLVVGALSIVVLVTSVLAGTDAVRALVSLPLLVFLPGYAALTAVRPFRATDDPDPFGESSADRFDVRLRFLATAVGLSLLVVSAIGITLVPLGGSLVALIAGVAIVTVALCAATALQRRDAGSAEGASAFSGIAPFADDAGRGSLAIAALTGLLVVGAGLTAVGPAGPDADGFTEFYLLEPAADGGAIAHDAVIDPDARADFLVGVENQEREPTNYTVVAQFQITDLARNERLLPAETESGTANRAASIPETEPAVTDCRELTRFHADLAHNETRQLRHTFVPPVADNRSRVVYLLYRGDPPANTTRGNAYRSLVVWDQPVRERPESSPSAGDRTGS